MKSETMMKMDFSSTRFTAIVFLAISIVAQSFGDPVVLHHPPTNNDTSKKLTCISKDDDSALVWNYNPKKPYHVTGRNIFTSFEPRKPTSKNITKCAIWNSTLCLAEWKNIGDWNVVDSARNPMGPVFDYRWEDFEEIVVDGFPHDHEYRYVKKFEKSSGTAIFSVRGLRDLNIFLCGNKTPENGPCFWIIIGGWRGERSAIRTCVARAPEQSQLNEERKCIGVANATHGGVPVIDAYEWRTFRLEWNNDEKTIRISNETEIEPFLDVTVDQWYPVSHLSIQSETRFRIRFHFYKYFQTKKKNAVISTTEFLPNDKSFCVELLVGLCPDCQLNVTLVDSEGKYVTVRTISGLENSISEKLLNWRSVRLDTTLPNLNFEQLKLKISTMLNGNEVEGQWAIDGLRTCKSLGGFRQSTITTDREIFQSSASLWPTVKCQKLLHTSNSVVDSLSSSSNAGPSSKPLFDVTPKNNGSTMNPSQGFETKDHDVNDNPSLVPDVVEKGGNKVVTVRLQPISSDTEYKISGKIDELLLNRKVRSSDVTNVSIDVYEGDRDRNTISLRLNGPHLEDSEIRSYTVSIKKNGKEIGKRPFRGSGSELKCKYWENALCFEKLPFLFTHRPEYVDIKVCKMYESDPVECTSKPWYLDLFHAPSRPCNLTLANEGHGIVKLKWSHPRFTYAKLTKFRISIENTGSKLKQNLIDVVWTEDYSFTKERKEHETQLHLFPSTSYLISVFAVNRDFGAGTKTSAFIDVMSSIRFANEKLNVSWNGTLIKLVVPEVINATLTTFVDIVVRGMLTCYQNQSSPSVSLSNDTSLEKEWRVANYQVNDTVPKSFTIGANQVHDMALNCSLHPEKTYTIEVNVRDSDSNPSDTLRAEITLLPIGGKTSTKAMNQNLIWLIILLIIVICLLLLFIWHRKYNRIPRQPRTPSYFDVIPLDSTTTSRNNLTMLHTVAASTSLPGGAEIPLSTRLWTERKRNEITKLPREPSYLEIIPPSSQRSSLNNFTALVNGRSSITKNGEAETRLSAHTYAIPNEPDSCSVTLEYFEEYTKGAAASGRLYSQFMLLPRGLTEPCDYGSLPENMPKNRSRNQIAYDRTRVVLEKIPGNPYSDYINASYIKGYRKQRAYIATQGPKPNTVNDFWRMIWQEDVRVICMLVNVTEGDTKLCEKYWPDVGTRVKYSKFRILNVSNRVFANYTIRKFKLSYQQATREITHLHYTGWPIHGVPMTQSIVAYVQTLVRTAAGNGPVVVHCDTGDGRTGTVILCDICLRQAIAERIIDVTAVITRMRDSRANMVGTPQQYLLAHIIISESMVSIPTKIPCTGILSKEIQRLRQQLPNDLKRLNDTMWHQEALDSFADLEPLDELVSEMDAVINRTDVSQTLERKSNQISAVTVDGVKTKNQYLASWLPPPLTLINFWQFITEEKIKLIIILQCSDLKNPTCCDIFPDERILLSMPHIQLENKTSLDDGEYFTTEKLLLTDTSENNAGTQSVTVLTCKGWDYGQTRRPPPPAALVSLWEASERIPREAGQTLVLCHDGITGCGLYLALSFVLERMAVDRECDVISAIRTVRRSIPEIVPSKEQCEYLYDAAETYAEYFQHYANFT